ncbi:MAG: GNAT family N-acetyltransferase [Chloroflexi bacterium]|nr:GNAT family N-acetyltransferase [Chloroflexota bacterium]|tara:strand:+ start:5307 stop:5801 length:495 start_codon:yes stop_codon:yes gene_type:complete
MAKLNVDEVLSKSLFPVPATINDGVGIQELINHWAAQGLMLPRTLAQTYENLRDFFVVKEGEKIIACSALHIVWDDMAELKSLAVAPGYQSGGYGSKLVTACVEEGRRLGMQQLFALSYEPEFFERLGWKVANVMELPRKVWNECYRCPKFPGCNEIALTYDLR